MARHSTDFHTLDLFDTDERWNSDPAVAFAAFVRTPEFVQMRRGSATAAPRALRSQSAKIYTAMFGRFCRWMTDEGLGLRHVDHFALERFLETRNRAGRKMASAIRVRYLRMLERVYDHLTITPNPARHACMEIVKTPGAAGCDRPKAWLQEHDQAKFIAALPVPASWKDRRDRAMLAMLLGAGLTVREITRISGADVSEFRERGAVWIDVNPLATAGQLHRQHRTLLRQFAVDEVLAWKRERTALGIAGDLLFASTLGGKAMDPSTVFRKVKATFARAGLDPGRRGGRTLRNSYAIRELVADGVTVRAVEHVTGLLGLHEQRSTLRYLAHGTVANAGTKRPKGISH